MRPVSRPEYTGIQYGDYKSFRQPLIDAFGPHCSYCERIDKLDVEHVVPRSSEWGKALVTTWTNLLLGCPRCNRDFKSNVNADRSGYIWPDTHNTFSLLKYYEDGRVKAKPGLQPDIATKAENMIDLVRLDDGQEDQQALNIHRKTQFKIAKRIKDNYLNGTQTINEIKDFASPAWSVWMTVFNEIPEVVAVLKSDAIKGTNQSYDY